MDNPHLDIEDFDIVTAWYSLLIDPGMTSTRNDKYQTNSSHKD